MKTIAIIPARGGSKRLPQKNIKLLGSIPLIAHSIIYAKKNSKYIDEVYVTTDDENIKSIAEQYGAKIIDRPQELASDFEPTISAINHAISCINTPFDTIVLLQPTNPLRPENLLSECLEVYYKNNLDSLFTVTRNHQKFGKIINSCFVPFNYEIGQRSQDLEPIYFENGLIYISSKSLILNNKIIDKNSFPFITDSLFSHVDIDTQEDFDYATYILNTKKNNL